MLITKIWTIEPFEFGLVTSWSACHNDDPRSKLGRPTPCSKYRFMYIPNTELRMYQIKSYVHTKCRVMYPLFVLDMELCTLSGPKKGFSN